MVIDGLVVNEVRIFVCVCGYGFFSFYVLYGVQMSLNPWLGCEEQDEWAWAQELNDRQVLFECGHGRYWYLGDRVMA